MRMVDRARFELAASWRFDFLGNPGGLQTMRSAGLIYRPTVNDESITERFNPYALIYPHVECQPIEGLLLASMPPQA
jgi:hypothetical protein